MQVTLPFQDRWRTFYRCADGHLEAKRAHWSAYNHHIWKRRRHFQGPVLNDRRKHTVPWRRNHCGIRMVRRHVKQVNDPGKCGGIPSSEYPRLELLSVVSHQSNFGVHIAPYPHSLCYSTSLGSWSCLVKNLEPNSTRHFWRILILSTWNVRLNCGVHSGKIATSMEARWTYAVFAERMYCICMPSLVARVHRSSLRSFSIMRRVKTWLR